MRKKRTILLVCLLALAGLILLLALPDAPQDDPPPPSSPEESATPSYMVRSYQGRVAVFRFGEDTPLEIRDSSVHQFPEADRQLLAQGIPAYSEEELHRILEDYSE